MKELPINYTKWNLKPLFDGDDDPKMIEARKKVEEANSAFVKKWKNRDDYLKNLDALKEALDEYELLKRNFGEDGDEGYYFHLRTVQDENSPDLKAKENNIRDFAVRIQNEIQFFELRLAKIPQDMQKKLLENRDLEKYKHYLESLFIESKYLLSEPEEKIMNLKGGTSYGNWVRMTSGFLAKEEREILLEDSTRAKKSFAEVMSLIDSNNKTVRDAATKALNDILQKNVEIAEHELNSILQDKKNNDELRGFTRPDQSRHIADDMDTEIVDTLLKTITKRFDISRRYYSFKAQLMGVDKLEYHERNVPYGTLEKQYTFEDAAQLVHCVFGELDQKFADIFKCFLTNGQIDIYPRKGKSDGAFCAHYLLSQPTYILLNYTNKLRDVLTLTHEMGHAINNELMRERQHALHFSTPLSTAEVASTFMEDFIVEKLLRDADDELRLSLMMSRLNDDISTIFRQVACYNFEQELHANFRAKGYLSYQEIGTIFLKHMNAYMGDAVEQSSGSENWWVYWSHIRNYFYVYSYASGLLISKSMQCGVRSDSSFIENVKEFLSAGRSDSPKNIFAKMEIDITKKDFWDNGIDEIERLLKETIILAKKLGKIS
ncbi:MAG: M3 family oligoendopeptidase [Patescibacteria group bacterium]